MSALDEQRFGPDQVTSEALATARLQPGDLVATGAAASVRAKRRGVLPAGVVVTQAEYPALFRAVGTAHNTGGEPATSFRTPNPTAPAGLVWLVKT